MPSPSLRNLISGDKCGRVFPAGVGPGSPSRDAANWPPSRFSRSVGTRRRYGCLRTVFPSARLFRAPIWCSLGGVVARERQGALSRRAWWHSIGWVRTRFVEGGGQLDCRRARRVLNPYARELKARAGRFLREKLISDHVFFLPTRVYKKRRMGKIRGAFFRDAQGFGWPDAGSRAGFIGSRPPPPWTSVFHFSLFLYDVWP